MSGEIRELLQRGVKIRSAALGRIMIVVDAEPGDGWVTLKCSERARKLYSTRFSSGDRVWIDRRGGEAVIRNYTADLKKAFRSRR